MTFKSDRCDDITVIDVLKAADDFDHSPTGEYDFVGYILAAESLHVGHCDNRIGQFGLVTDKNTEQHF